MSAMARCFAPSQSELVESMRSNEVPVPLIVAELRRNTDAMIQKRDVYNAPRSKRTEMDRLSQIESLLLALRGNPDFTFKVGADSSTHQLK